MYRSLLACLGLSIFILSIILFYKSYMNIYQTTASVVGVVIALRLFPPILSGSCNRGKSYKKVKLFNAFIICNLTVLTLYYLYLLFTIEGLVKTYFYTITLSAIFLTLYCTLFILFYNKIEAVEKLQIQEKSKS